MLETQFHVLLKNKREKLNYSRQDLADILHISSQTIYKYEKGISVPDISLIPLLSKTLQVDIESLMNGIDSKNNHFADEYVFNSEQFSKNLKYLRLKNNITLKDLSEKLNIQYQTISKWEKGSSLPSYEMLLKLKELYQVDINHLIFGLDNKESKKEKRYKKEHILLISLSSLFVITAILIAVIIPSLISNNNLVTVIYNYQGLFDTHREKIHKGEKAKYIEKEHEGYELVSYLSNGVEFDFSTPIYEDIELYAQFKKKTFHVVFEDFYDQIIKEEYVDYLCSATPPEIWEINVSDEYAFTSWDYDYTQIKKDVVIHPLCREKYHHVYFSVGEGELDECVEYSIENYDVSKGHLPTPHRDGYVFGGWTFGGLPIQEESIRFFDEIYLEAKWLVSFGSYPQKDVTNTPIASSLRSLLPENLPTSENWNSWTSFKNMNGYILDDSMFYKDITYQNKKYRAVYLNKYRDFSLNIGTYNENNSCQNRNGYETNHIYFFQFEDLLWEELTEANQSKKFMLNSVIDSLPFYDKKFTYIRDENHTKEPANYYVYSSIRTWLNEDFYQTAFSEEEKNLIQLSNVDNNSSNANRNVYDWESCDANYHQENCQDYVFLPSYGDLSNINEMNENSYSYEAYRLSTDYAKCMGVYEDVSGVNINYSFYYYPDYWTRSISENVIFYAQGGKFVHICNQRGNSSQNYPKTSNHGVVPMIKIRNK